MRCATKETPFQFIDGNILKSCRTGLTNYTQPISHHIAPLVTGANTHTQTHAHATHTHTQTHTHTYRHTYQCANKNNFKKPGVHVWFKNAFDSDMNDK